MNLAHSENGELLEPTRDIPGFCPSCHTRLIPRLGSCRYHHWAHKPGAECDTWAEESFWHFGWKNQVDKKFQEIAIEKDGIKHRADVRLPTGIIVEFQKKSLDLKEWEARENFYGKMIWVIYFQKDWLLERDIRKRYFPTLRDSLIEVKGLSQRFLDPIHRFPMFLDFNDGDMFWIKEFEDSFGRKSRFYGRFLTKIEFLEKYLRNPHFSDIESLKFTTYHKDIERMRYKLWADKEELESVKKDLRDAVERKQAIERGNLAREKYEDYCRYRQKILIAKRNLVEQSTWGYTSPYDKEEIAKLDNELKNNPLREPDDDLFWCE